MPTPNAPAVCLECRVRFARTRGLCKSCYARLGWRARAGKTTWIKLEKAGRAKPAGKSGWHGSRGPRQLGT